MIIKLWFLHGAGLQLIPQSQIPMMDAFGHIFHTTLDYAKAKTHQETQYSGMLPRRVLPTEYSKLHLCVVSTKSYKT